MENDNAGRNCGRLKICLVTNIVLLLAIILLISSFDSHTSKYWRYGPQEDLVLISVPINTLTRYWTLVLFIGFFKITQVVVSEIALPILGFNIYNPDKTVITEFTRNELQFYGNSMYLIDSVRYTLMIVVSVSQVDIALWGVFFSEVTTIFTIRTLLNEKTFTKGRDAPGSEDENAYAELESIV